EECSALGSLGHRDVLEPFPVLLFGEHQLAGLVHVIARLEAAVRAPRVLQHDTAVLPHVGDHVDMGAHGVPGYGAISVAPGLGVERSALLALSVPAAVWRVGGLEDLLGRDVAIGVTDSVAGDLRVHRRDPLLHATQEVLLVETHVVLAVLELPTAPRRMVGPGCQHLRVCTQERHLHPRRFVLDEEHYARSMPRSMGRTPRRARLRRCAEMVTLFLTLGSDDSTRSTRCPAWRRPCMTDGPWSSREPLPVSPC